jgi:hypothetical protein
VDAMDMKNQLVERIMNSVRMIRAKDSGSFFWPADIPPPNEHINPWSLGFLASSSEAPTSHPPSDDPEYVFIKRLHIGDQTQMIPSYYLTKQVKNQYR